MVRVSIIPDWKTPCTQFVRLEVIPRSTLLKRESLWHKSISIKLLDLYQQNLRKAMGPHLHEFLEFFIVKEKHVAAIHRFRIWEGYICVLSGNAI